MTEAAAPTPDDRAPTPPAHPTLVRLEALGTKAGTWLKRDPRRALASVAAVLALLLVLGWALGGGRADLASAEVREGPFRVSITEAGTLQALRELDEIRQSVELQRRAVEVADQQRRLAVLRYQRGLGSNFDVVDAESSLVTARSALVQLLTSYAIARLDLKRTTGTLDVDTEFAP